MTATESENVRITRLLMQLTSDGRYDELADHVHDEIVLDCPFPAFFQGPPRVGIEKYREGVKFIPYIFTSFKLHIHEIYDCPDQDAVVFEQTSSGILAANNQPYSNRYLMIFKFRDGKVVLWREFFNPELMTRQMATTLTA